MKIIKNEELEVYSSKSAIFLTNDSVIVDNFEETPLVNFVNVSTEIVADITNIYLYQDLLIILCKEVVPTQRFGQYNIKSYLNISSIKIQSLLVKVVHWLTWDRKVNYCSNCGGELYQVNNITEKKCSICNSLFYPNLAPAIMVLIQRGEEILLARSPHFNPGVYSAIAGFVDIGETAEEAVHREVKEELGIEVKNLKYFGSQSWPFPNSFMIAFSAHYLGGELKLDKNEIEDAQWYNRNNLPLLPNNCSIARSLIDKIISQI
jgi:NADH pyrophosphatase NudC (nudix superfamily)